MSKSYKSSVKKLMGFESGHCSFYCKGGALPITLFRNLLSDIKCPGYELQEAGDCHGTIESDYFSAGPRTNSHFVS